MVQKHVCAVLTQRKRPVFHCIGGWVGPRANLEGCRKSRPLPGFFVLHFYFIYNCFFCVDCFEFCLFCLLLLIQTFMTPTGFEPGTPASDRPQALAWNRSATGIGRKYDSLEELASICDYLAWVYEINWINNAKKYRKGARSPCLLWKRNVCCRRTYTVKCF